MKLIIQYFAFFTFTLSIFSCGHMTIQEQLDQTYGKYVEEVKPENYKFYKAYNKALDLWETPYGEVNIKTSFGKAHVMVCRARTTKGPSYCDRKFILW